MKKFKYVDRRREGETTLRQCQLTQLYLLHLFDYICKKHNIPYFLCARSLLGAMRHNGFIPWDDDLDVGVKASHYQRLLKILRSELPSNVELQTTRQITCAAIPFAKLRDKTSFFFERRPDLRTTDPSGIYIDIFPFEELPEIGSWAQRLFVKVIASSWMRNIQLRNLASKGFLIGIPCLWVSVVFKVVHSFVRVLLWMLKKMLPCKSVFVLCEWGLPLHYPYDKVYPVAEHTFEDAIFPVPADPDAILTTRYGDWRQIPPPDKRPRHARIIDPFQSAV